MGIRSKFNPLGGGSCGEKSLVYTHVIPSDGYSVALPIRNAVYINRIYVRWGDGSSETVNGGAFPAHTYENAGTYTVEVSGPCGQIPLFNFYGSGDAETATARTALQSVDSANVAFYDGQNQAVDFSMMFAWCRSLQSIPETLFCRNTGAVKFQNLFFRCYALESVPAKLFSGNHAANDFMGVFARTQNLLTLPSGLFDQTSISTLYQGLYASNIQNLPSQFFAKCEKLGVFTEAFTSCSSLRITEDMFCDPSDKTTRFSQITPNFARCFNRTSWTGSSAGTAPDLWNYTFAGTPVTTSCFAGDGNSATSLSNYADIPAEWK